MASPTHTCREGLFLSLAGAATSIIFLAIKRFVATSILLTSILLSRQKTCFVVTNTWSSAWWRRLPTPAEKGYFYRWRELPQVSFFSRVCRGKTRLLSRQKYACRDKVLPNILSLQFCCDKSSVATKSFVATNILLTSILLSRQKTCFVVTNRCLSRQKLYLCQLPPMIYF